MPGIVGHLFYIGGSLADRVLVESVEGCLVDEVDHGFGDVFQNKCGIHDGNFSPLVPHNQVSAVVDALLRISHGMSHQRDLSCRSFYLMGCLGGKQDSAVDAILTVGTEADGDYLVGMRCKVFAAVADAVLFVCDIHQGAVQTEFSAVVLNCGTTATLDVECGQRLVELAVVALYVELEGISQGIVFGKEGLSDFGNPKGGVSLATVRRRLVAAFLIINGFSCP